MFIADKPFSQPAQLFWKGLLWSDHRIILGELPENETDVARTLKFILPVECFNHATDLSQRAHNDVKTFTVYGKEILKNFLLITDIPHTFSVEVKATSLTKRQRFLYDELVCSAGKGSECTSWGTSHAELARNLQLFSPSSLVPCIFGVYSNR